MRDVWGRVKAALCSPAACILMAVALLILLLNGLVHEREHTTLERRISDSLSRALCAGKIEVVIRTQQIGEQEVPCGAVAVASCAQDPIVRMELTRALCALLGLQASEVEVIGSSGGGL